jgi:hypothetical protein
MRNKEFRMLLRILLLTLLSVPVLSWAVYKPLRVLAPQWNGVSCISDEVCLELPEKAEEANALYQESLGFVNVSVGLIQNHPRMTFCSTEECFQAFGFDAPAKAKTVGLSGIVIGPDGWKKHILRHEIIHHLQSERLGVLGQWRSPAWFKEGMAYSLSMDTRKLSEPFDSHREKFQSWYGRIGKQDMWQAAKNKTGW